MRLELEHAEVDLAPGEQVSVGVRVVNDGQRPINVTLGIAGLDAEGVRPVAELGVIAPGAMAATTLVFALPKGSLAGLREVAIRATDRLAADAAQAAQSTRSVRLGVRVRSTERLSLALRRTEVWGRFRGKIRADLRNQGTEPITVRLWGEGDDLSVQFERDELTLHPGHGALVRGTVRRQSLSWRGEHRRPFVVTAQGHSTPRTTSGSYVQRGIIPGPFFLVLAVLIVGAVWIAGLLVAKDTLLDTTSSATTTVVGSETTGGSDGTGTDGTDPEGTGTDGTGTGTDGTGSTDGSGGGGDGDGATGAVPISIIGAVDGPSVKSGTVVVLELISLGSSSSDASLKTKVAAFAPAVATSEPVSTTQRTVTDDSGRFRFDDLTQTPGLYRLTLLRTGFDVFSQVVNVDGTTPNVEIAAKMVPAAGSLGGRVVDGNGAALGGVAITVTSDGLSYTAVSADGTGVWQVAGVGTPATYLVQFAKPGYAAASLVQPLEGGQSVSSLVATMKAGSGTVRGVVQSTHASEDGTLAGVGGLTVTLALGDMVIETTTLTDEPVGFFEFPGIDYGTYALTISGDGWQTSARGVDVQAGLVDLGVITANSSTATITGSVTQEAKGNCVVPYFPNLSVSTQQACGGVGITAQGADTYRTTSASGTGSYQLAGIPPGTYLLTVERFGYVPVTLSVEVLAGDTFFVDDVELHVQDNSSDANGTLLLNISTVGGALPLKGTVAVLGQVSPPTMFGGAGETEVAIEIESLLPGNYKVVIRANSVKSQVITAQIPLSGSSDVYDVTLVPLASLTGQITSVKPGEGSVGVPGAVVFAAPVDPEVAEVVSPPGTPVPPSQSYLRRDPTSVGEVRLCERNVAASGEPEEWVTGLCTLTDSSGSYHFDTALDGGQHRVYAPMNVDVSTGDSVALDHVMSSAVVTLVLDDVTRGDLNLDRLGAVIGSVRSVDLSTGSSYSPLSGFTVSATRCEVTADAGAVLGCKWPSSGGVYDEAQGRPSYPADGEYRLDRLVSGADDYLLRFQKAGFEDSFRRVPPPTLGTDALLDLVMLPEPYQVSLLPYWVKAGTSTQVNVADTVADTLAEVSVSFSGVIGYTDATPPVPRRQTVTDSTADADGHYDSGDVHFVAGDVEITVTIAGFVTLSTTVPIDPDGAAGAGVSGVQRTFDPSGVVPAVLSADVEVTPLARDLVGRLDVVCCSTAAVFTPTNVADVYAELSATVSTPDGVSVTTSLDDTGNYSFPDLAPGTYSIEFSVSETEAHNLVANITLPAVTDVEVGTAGNATAPTLIAALRQAVVAGVVTDSDDDVPLPGATVSLVTGSGASLVRHWSTSTDDNGAYRLTFSDVPGEYSLLVEKSDGRTDCVGPTLSLYPGDDLEQNLSCIGPRGTVVGNVVSRDSVSATSTEVLPGATVKLFRKDPVTSLAGALVAETTTGTNGEFSFSQIPTGLSGARDYIVKVTMPGFTDAPAAYVTVYPNQPCSTYPDPIVLVAATRPLTVTVRSSTPGPGSAAVPLGGVVITASLSGSSDIVGTTNDAGVVVLDLTPGSWTITSSGADQATALGLTVPHHNGRLTSFVPRGTGGLSTAMTLDGPFAVVSGRVLAVDNGTGTPSPLADATVFVTTDLDSVAVLTGADGMFELEVPVNHAVGTAATVVVSATDYDVATPISTTLQLSPTNTNGLGDITLNASAQAAMFRVKGRESGANLSGVLVTARLDGSPSTEVSATTDSFGTATLALVPGSWSITTSGGAAARVSGVDRPHGDITGSLVVVRGVAPEATVLRPAALVPVSGAMNGLPSGDVGTFAAQAVSGATIIATRIGDASPPEPVNTYMATSDADGYSIGSGLTPGDWELTATAVGHEPASITIRVVAGTPITDADIELTELPMHLSGHVYSVLDEPVANVEVRFSALVDGQQMAVRTDADGAYSIDLAASIDWEVRFDPRSAGDSYQDVPVLYRYIGNVIGDTSVQLDHTMFATVVSLSVTVKGVLPTRCSEVSCVQHDLSTTATVTIGDSGTPEGSPSRVERFLDIPSLNTSDVDGVQVAVFPEIPALTSFSLAVSAPGYVDGAVATLDLSAGGSPCVGGPETARCITVDLNTVNRDVALTITDVNGDPVTDAAVRVRSKPPSTDISLSCAGVTDADGTCTISGVQPSFGVYGPYDVVVTPQVDGPWNELIADLEVPAGAGVFAATVGDVGIKPVITTDLTDQAAWDGDNAVFTAIASGDPAPTASWIRISPGGVETPVVSGVVTSNPAIGSTRSILTLAADLTDDGYSYRAVFSSQSNAGSTATEVTSSAALLSVARLMTQPVDALVWQGDNAVFTAATDGATTTVQWQRFEAGSPDGWLDMAGRTSTTLSVPTSGTGAVGDGDQFRAVFTLAGAGSRSTSAAALSVVALPSAPVDNTVWAGKTATFSAASTDPAATVRWEVDAAGGAVSWAIVAGATSTTLTIASATSGMNGNRYRAVFTVAGGATRTTASALLSVKSATAPSDYSAWAGETVVFSAPVTPSATGVTVQWQQRTSSGASWTNVGTGVNLTLSSVTAAMDGYEYQAILTISGTSSPLSSAVLTLGAATLSVSEITTSPTASVIVWAGDTFSISAAATHSPSVQWQRDPSGPTGYSDISGASSTTYSLSGASLTASLNGSRFQAVFTLMNGLVSSTATTSSTLLTVASITQQPSDVSKNAGQNATFSADASYAGATVQWQVNSGGGWSDVVGATNTSLTLNSVTAGMNGNRYRAVFTIAGILVPDHASDSATLTVN